MNRSISFTPKTALRIGGILAVALTFVVSLAWSQAPPPPSTQFGPAAAPAPAGHRDVQIVVVQMTWKPEDFATESAYRARIDSLLQQGLKQTHRNAPILVVFPEDIGAPLFFLNHHDDAKSAGTLAEAITALAQRHLPEVLFRSWGNHVSLVRAIALTRATEVGKTYVETFSSLARQYGVHIIAGSAPMPDFPMADDGSSITYSVKSSDVYNVSYFFGPDGRIIGKQHKVNLIPLEQKDGLDLSHGALDDLKVFPTEFGTIGIAICADVFYDDVISNLAAKGADILVQPSANPGKWDQGTQDTWLHSAWTAAQNHPELRCVINPMMNGLFFDLKFEGQSSITTLASRAPDQKSYALTEKRGGFLALADQADAEQVFCITLPAATP